MELKKNVSLAPYTSWKVGGPADYFLLPGSKGEILEALTWAYQNKIPVTPLGGGSNVLISDKGVRGLVLCFRSYTGVEDFSDERSLRITCKAGTLKIKAMRSFLKENLAPALFLSGLPGDVAGGVVMNAGLSEKLEPREFVEIVESFKVFQLEGEAYTEKTYLNKDITWSYRSSQGWQPGIISEVTLAWPKEKKVERLKEKVREAQALRASKQPLGKASCGSVFKNPYDDPNNKERRSAGYLIEKAGLKGYQYGGAEISRKHANFLINNNNASALDLHCALSIAKEKVAHLYGIRLKSEVKYIGDWKDLVEA